MFLIVGANSEIGSATARSIRGHGGKVVTTTRRRVTAPDEVHLDLNAPLGNFPVPQGVQCACIFVAVARLAACEADPLGSARINVEQTIALIDHLAARGVYTLFLSTNQVFNGDKPHVPADAPISPISEYGRQKAQVERMLLTRMAGGAPIGVLRLAKVISPDMALIARWKQELAAGRSIRAFADMTMAPASVDLVATCIERMMEDRLPVIAQLTGPRDVAYAEVGRFLAEMIGADPRLVEPVSALENGMPKGSTPRNTTLDSSYIAEKYGLTISDAFDVIGAL
jgi:dTDP-4-dehydrorhamnose reductase